MTPSSSILRVRREPPNPKGWSIWVCALCTGCTTVCLAGEMREPYCSGANLVMFMVIWNPICYFFRPNCFQIVVQHFSEEQYIFYFAGEAPEQAQVKGGAAQYSSSSNFWFILGYKDMQVILTWQWTSCVISYIIQNKTMCCESITTVFAGLDEMPSDILQQLKENHSTHLQQEA